jgi:hypothetical protein
MNERAGLFYHKLHRVALVLLGILTVVVGSKGVLTIQGRTNLSLGVNIVLTLCDLTLAILAGLMSTLSWHAKATAYTRRAGEYSEMSVRIRVDLMDTSVLEDGPDYVQGIMVRIKELERITDPLPLRYRRDADIRRGIISMWASSGFRASHPHPHPHPHPPVPPGLGLSPGSGPGTGPGIGNGAGANPGSGAGPGSDTVVDMANVNTFHDMSMRLNLEALNDATLDTIDEATLEGCVRDFGTIFVRS